MTHQEHSRSIAAAVSILAGASALSGCESVTKDIINGGHGRGVLSKVFNPEKPEINRVGDATLRPPFRIELIDKSSTGCTVRLTRKDSAGPELREETIRMGETKNIATTNRAELQRTFGNLTTTVEGPAHLLATCTPTEVSLGFQSLNNNQPSIPGTGYHAPRVEPPQSTDGENRCIRASGTVRWPGGEIRIKK